MGQNHSLPHVQPVRKLSDGRLNIVRRGSDYSYRRPASSRAEATNLPLAPPSRRFPQDVRAKAGLSPTRCEPPTLPSCSRAADVLPKAVPTVGSLLPCIASLPTCDTVPANCPDSPTREVFLPDRQPDNKLPSHHSRATGEPKQPYFSLLASRPSTVCGVLYNK